MSILADTGAQLLAAIRPEIGQAMAAQYGAPRTRLAEGVRVTGFNGSPLKEKARDVVWLTLRIQGYRHLIPFLKLPLGQHDIILGFK